MIGTGNYDPACVQYGQTPIRCVNLPQHQPANAFLSISSRGNDCTTELPIHDASATCGLHSPNSPMYDDGYSSVSSLSTLRQVNRELDDRVFKSTPIRNESIQSSSHFGSLTDSGLGYSHLPVGSGLESGWNPRSPANFQSFWSNIGCQLQRQASLLNPQPSPTTALVAPLLQHVPFNLYTTVGVDQLSVSNPRVNEQAAQSTQFNLNRTSAFTKYCSGLRINGQDCEIIPVEHSQDMQCQQVFSKVRAEMIGLIDKSMKQLELFLQQRSTQLLVDNQCVPFDDGCVPLNLKSNRSNPFDHRSSEVSPYSPARPWIHSERSNAMSQKQTDKTNVEAHQATCLHSPRNSVTTNLLTPKEKHTLFKRRRLRIRTGVRRLRIRRSTLQIVNRLPLDRCGSYQNNEIAFADGDETLDLRVRQNPSINTMGRSLEQDGFKTKTPGLSAVHLKRAKLMFMYARYPNSSVLKSHFPDVAFTRATTAQLVKWFSNFREFFYIQVEKVARQYLTQRKTLKEVEITRSHELVHILELHYNKDRDVETPEEFVQTTQVALQEFLKMISNNSDRDQSWKKTIYKTVSLLDTAFPDCLQNIK
ncbi:hypothetical protein EG68_09789 [Paragonimus skrjabini miyazakii]|uniref:Prospero domain-containing protein n=1 Tax=Paragonimus skrjabini miyazakii TaxID=59628 RepID=A0A8S9YHE0_9TREM|nr:hypothetical protein EG68_09789 [Paragonimus skrjabini miyazakii]